MKYNYSNGFEQWWELFIHTSPSPKGSKFEAYKVWKEMHLEPYLEEICKGVIAHQNNDDHFKKKGDFVSPWKHACRWLSNLCWEQVDEQDIAKQRLIHARKKEIDKKRDKDRATYGAVIEEWTDEQYDKYVESNGHELDWLRQEKKGVKDGM